MLDYFDSADTIYIQEKLDGANASFDLVDGVVHAYSRKTELSPDNTLRGFLGFANSIPSNLINKDYIYFGEWLVKHQIDYGEHLNKFYLFDVYEKTTEKYLGWETVQNEAERIGLLTVPLFYSGEFVSDDHINSFAGKSFFVEDGKGEGVVVRNYNYEGDDKFLKYKNEKFSEFKIPKVPRVADELDYYISSFVVKARVEKLLYKLVDEGIIQEKYTIKDLGLILRSLNKRVADDVVKEEEMPDGFTINDMYARVSKKVPAIVKDILFSEVV